MEGSLGRDSVEERKEKKKQKEQGEGGFEKR
jgi:hypothetical protein